MTKPRVGNTASGAATCRLIEPFQPEETRLFDDPLVKILVGTPIWIRMPFARLRSLTIQQTDAVMPDIYGLQIGRTRFLDDAVQTALWQAITQRFWVQDLTSVPLVSARWSRREYWKLPFHRYSRPKRGDAKNTSANFQKP